MNTPLSPFTPAVKALLIANGLAFFVQMALGDWAFFLALLPYPYTLPWQLVTYSFLHGSTGHLLLNMFALWMLGSDIERFWGSQRFLVFYFVCVVGAAVVQLLVNAYTGRGAPTVGASGGVFGILLAFGMMFPHRRLILLFLPIPIPARWFVIGYGALSLWWGVTGTADGIAHFAHLGGMLFGWLLIVYWRRPPPSARRPDQPGSW